MAIFVLLLGGLIAATAGWMMVRTMRMTRSPEGHLSAMEQVTGPPRG